MTYAPEQDPDNVLPEIARATAETSNRSLVRFYQASELFGCGCGVTHLFNAMSGLHHRDPGVAFAALSAAEYAQIICDELRMAEPAFQLARRIPQLYSVTDSTSAVECLMVNTSWYTQSI